MNFNSSFLIFLIKNKSKGINFNWKEIIIRLKIAMADTISSLDFESDRNRWSNSIGLESKSLTIWFWTTNRLLSAESKYFFIISTIVLDLMLGARLNLWTFFFTLVIFKVLSVILQSQSVILQGTLVSHLKSVTLKDLVPAY